MGRFVVPDSRQPIHRVFLLLQGPGPRRYSEDESGAIAIAVSGDLRVALGPGRGGGWSGDLWRSRDLGHRRGGTLVIDLETARSELRESCSCSIRGTSAPKRERAGRPCHTLLLAR